MEFNRNGCFITLLFFTTEVIWGCAVKSMGVLLPTLRDQFTTQTWVIGTVLALMGVASDVAGVLTIPLEKCFSCRRILIFSSVALSIGLVLVAFSTSIVHIALALALLTGPSLGIITILDKVLLARHFNEHFDVACGIGHTGKGLALLAIAPLTQLFLDTYGWRGAALLIGGLCMNLIPSAVVVQDVRPQYENVAGSSTNNDQELSSPSPKASCLGICKSLDLGILTEFNFWIVFMCNFGVTCTFDAWQLYFVPHLEAKGFSGQVAASLSTAAAVGYLIGAVIWSPFTDRGLIKYSTAIIISSLALTLSFVVDPWLNDVISYIIVTFICGLFASALNTLIDIMAKDLLGSERLISAYGWMRVFFIQRLVAGFVPGWIFDARSSYDLAFVIIGLIPTICLTPLLIGLMRKTV